MDETTKKVLMIMLIILGVVFIAFGAVFNYSQKDAHDWESLGLGDKETVEEVEPEAYTPFASQDDSSKKKVDPNAIRSIVLRNKVDEETESYRFEVYVTDKDTLLFNCWYPSKDGTITCVDEPINRSRLDDITDILERYTVSTTIKKYREAPGEISVEGDDHQALEIAFQDGDFVNVGFPNGAGPALEKYFKDLAEWLHTKKY